MSTRDAATQLSVAVIAGGPSAEAEVSRRSAEGVASALRRGGCSARVLELDATLFGHLRDGHFDVAFPVTHGPLGEDGCLQGLLEVLRLPYVGAGVRGSAIAAHKPSAKVMFRARRIPVADEVLVCRGEGVEGAAAEIRARLGTAVVIKPASGGSAIGVERFPSASTVEQVARALERVLVLDDALVERFHAGQEVTCGVLDGEAGPQALPPTAIYAKAANWYDFRSRYGPGGSEHRCPAPLEPQTYERVQELAVAAHVAVGARDLSRVDFVVEPDGNVLVLEVNTLPGMTPTSNYPEAAEVHGIPFADLCLRLCQRALARPQRTEPEPIALPV